MLSDRLGALTPDQLRDYYPLCPDFVIELRSGSDRLAHVQQKMRDYIDNGARLGWLIDPGERKVHVVHVYRPNEPVEVLVQPDRIAGDPVLPGLVVDLRRVWSL